MPHACADRRPPLPARSKCRVLARAWGSPLRTAPLDLSTAVWRLLRAKIGHLTGTQFVDLNQIASNLLQFQIYDTILYPTFRTRPRGHLMTGLIGWDWEYVEALVSGLGRPFNLAALSAGSELPSWPPTRCNDLNGRSHARRVHLDAPCAAGASSRGIARPASAQPGPRTACGSRSRDRAGVGAASVRRRAVRTAGMREEAPPANSWLLRSRSVLKARSSGIARPWGCRRIDFVECGAVRVDKCSCAGLRVSLHGHGGGQWGLVMFKVTSRPVAC